MTGSEGRSTEPTGRIDATDDGHTLPRDEFDSLLELLAGPPSDASEDSSPRPMSPPLSEPTSEIPTETNPAPSWQRHADERWVVGDPGRQSEIIPLAGMPWSRPDTVLDGATVEDLTFRAASLRGIGHQQYARPRQDAYGYLISEDEHLLVGCVADGVSQGRWSHHAADIACRVLTRGVLEALVAGAMGETPGWAAAVEALPWGELVDAANDAIVDTAVTRLRERGALEEAASGDESTGGDTSFTMADAARLLSTTAVVFAVTTTPSPEGIHPYVLGVVAGDSSAYLLSDKGWTPLTGTKGEEGGVISSAVQPLPGPQVVEVLQGQLHVGECLVVMTDGVGDPLGAGSGAVGHFLADAWTEPPAILAFGGHVGFLRKTFSDDRTAFAMWPQRT